jgi:hypothetical protein
MQGGSPSEKAFNQFICQRKKIYLQTQSQRLAWMKVKLDTMDVYFKAIMEQETFKEAYHPGHEGVGPITSLGVQLQTTFGCRLTGLMLSFMLSIF